MLQNGLNMKEDLDSRMREYVDGINELSDMIAAKNKKIQMAQKTIEDFQSSGLSTPELEQTFTNDIREAMQEKASFEELRETKMDAATQELNEAKAEYVKVVDRITSASENPSSAALSAIRDRLNELGDWENELKDAMNESDDEGPKRLVLKMKR